jgi:hypothetical protein
MNFHECLNKNIYVALTMPQYVVYNNYTIYLGGRITNQKISKIYDNYPLIRQMSVYILEDGATFHCLL